MASRGFRRCGSRLGKLSREILANQPASKKITLITQASCSNTATPQKERPQVLILRPHKEGSKRKLQRAA